jgi:hypothetical protein
MSRGVEAARRALIAAVRNIVGGVLGGRWWMVNGGQRKSIFVVKGWDGQLRQKVRRVDVKLLCRVGAYRLP